MHAGRQVLVRAVAAQRAAAAAGRQQVPQRAQQHVRGVATRTRVLASGDAHRIQAQHIDAPENNEATPFDFTPENLEKVKKVMSMYPDNYKKGAMIPLLDLAQRQHGGWLPVAAMNKVAKIVGAPNIQVYETASFYTMFNRQPIGKHHVQVCTTTPCMLRGAYDVLEAAKERLGVDIGETTPDRMFTLGEVECAGACVNAPCMSVGDDYYEDLTPEDTVRIIDAVAKGEKPPPGPQNGRKNCEGSQGQTTLLTEGLETHFWRKELDA